ncbi:MAG: ribonuclease P protein component [Actinobacteria bacterium]|nr:MAG: ribonuclease P protein component [Actinomycetota bacterium]
MHRIRDRTTFAELARARPARRGVVSLRYVHGGDHELARVAYSVSRGVGNAVARNRVRRRLRAAVQRWESALAPGSAYLLVGTREVLTEDFEEIVATVGALVRDAGDTRS